MKSITGWKSVAEIVVGDVICGFGEVATIHPNYSAVRGVTEGVTTFGNTHGCITSRAIKGDLMIHLGYTNA